MGFIQLQFVWFADKSGHDWKEHELQGTVDYSEDAACRKETLGPKMEKKTVSHSVPGLGDIL